MPRTGTTKKSPRKITHKKTSGQTKGTTFQPELSYETRLIITILLLLFIYPLGLIVMWGWMRNWPLWLKLLITAPLLLGILAFFGIMLLIGSVISHVRIEERIQQQEIQLTPMPTLPTTITPTSDNSGTY